MRSIADIHLQQGNPAKALELYQELLGIAEQVQGTSESQDAAMLCLNVAQAQLAMGSTQAAIKSVTNSVAIATQVCGTRQHAVVAKGLLALARVQVKSSDLGNGAENASEAVSIGCTLSEKWSAAEVDEIAAQMKRVVAAGRGEAAILNFEQAEVEAAVAALNAMAAQL